MLMALNDLNRDELPITGCERHIRREREAVRQIEDDKARFEEKYIAPLIKRRVVDIVVKEQGGPKRKQCSASHSHGKICAVCGELEEGSSSDSELEEAEIIARMREQKLERLELMREQERIKAHEQVGECCFVDFKLLAPQLIRPDAIVVCGLVDTSEKSHAIISALKFWAAQYPHVKFLYSEMSKDKVGLSEEFGWQLTYVTRLPEIVCYDRGVYAKHYGQSGKVVSSQMRELFQSVKEWVGDVLTKIMPISVSEGASKDEEEPIENVKTITNGGSSVGRSLASMTMTPFYQSDSDSDSNPYPTRKPQRVVRGSRKQVSVASMVQKTLYRRVESGSDSDD